MKIIFFGPACDRPTGEGSYTYHNMRAPLFELGHQIIDVDFRALMKDGGHDAVARHVKELVDRERPDLFFHMVCEDELNPEIARYISRNTSTVTAAFFSDDDWRLQHSLQAIPHYNFGITTAKQAVPVFRQAGHPHVILTQYGASAERFFPLPEVTKRYDVSFVGQAYQGRPELLTWLRAQGVSVRVWGQGWEQIPTLRDCAGGFLPQPELLKVFAASKIVLGLSWTSDGKALQIKGRLFEHAAAGAFQITTQDDRLADYFEIGREIVVYRDNLDLLAKIRHYLAHDDERAQIAQAGRDRVLKDHTWIQRFEQMFEAMNQMLPAGKPRLSSRAVPYRPTVSILTYVYNGEKYIDELIRSVRGQTYSDFEFLILDDGSTDRTREIVLQHADDPRLRYVHQDNIGRNLDAFHELINRSVALTSGELVCFAGADDLFLPEKLSSQVAEFAADPALDISFSDGYHIDAQGRELGSDFRFPESAEFTSRSLLRTLFKKNIIPHPTVMMKRSAIHMMGGFEGGYATDPHFWLKAAPYLRFRYIDRKLIKYRIHEEGASTSSNNRSVPETMKLLTEMRQRFTITDLYPELSECSDIQGALYSAYLHFGNLLFTGNIPVPQLALTEYLRALEHRPNGVEALNNAAIACLLLGMSEKSLLLFSQLRTLASSSSLIAQNLSIVAHLQSGHSKAGRGFTLLAEPASQIELIATLDPPKTLVTLMHSGQWPLAGVQTIDSRIPSSSVPTTGSDTTSMIIGSTQAGTSSRPNPMVSIIMPTYNRPEFLKKAVASVLNQTLQDFELIVINDNGDDVESLLSELDHNGKITYVRHGTNRERSAARNTGLKIARGQYIAYLDDDDRFLPDHLESLVTFLQSSDYRVAYTDAWRVHECRQGDRYVETSRDLPYSYEFDATKFLISNYIPILSVMHERACLDETGLFDERLASHEDWDLLIRLSRRFPFSHRKQITAEFTWRTDGSSTTSRNRADFSKTAEIIYSKYRAVSENIPGVCELQAQALRELQGLTGSGPSYTCSIIIPVWNKADLTRQCLDALASTTSDVTFEVIVVDNGSTDGTKDLLASLTGDVRIITNEDNLGFAKACNQGADVARGTYLVFLNNDTIPLQGWLSAMVAEVDMHPEVGIVGSKLLYADGTIQHAGVVFMRAHMSPYHIYRGVSADLPAVNQRREFQSVTAACMLIRRTLFKEVNGFDEGFINGFEDVDLCLKVREKGHHVVYQPRSVLHHLESQTPGRNIHDAHNSDFLRERWGASWWVGDEDLHYHNDGFKLVSGPRDVKFATCVKPVTDLRDRAAWAHVAAAQAAAVKQDWIAVRRELRLAPHWPNDPFVLSWGAKVSEHLNEPGFRLQFLSRYLELAEAPEVRLALARTLLEQKDLAGAEQHLHHLLRAAPAHAEALLLRGILCMQREQYREAETSFSSALRQGADRKKCLMGMGMASLGHAYPQGAWERFLQVLAEHPDDAEAIHWLLRAGTAQNRWAELSVQLRNYLSRNPGDLAARFALAGVLVRAEQIDAARREHDALRALAPDYDGLQELGQAITGKETLLAMESAHR